MSKLSPVNNITNLVDLIDYYDLFLFDLWGVIIDGADLYPGAKNTIEKILVHKNLIFVSNSSRTQDAIAIKLASLGLQVPSKSIITAGDLAKNMLSNAHKYFDVSNPKIYNFGLDHNAELWNQFNLQTVSDLEQADIMVISLGLLQQDVSQSHYDILQKAAELKIPAICANNDKILIERGKVIYCASYFADKFEEFGGKVVYIGKPFEPIFQEALSLYPQVAKERILMTGDTFDTDVLGANKIGIDAAVVTTGNMYSIVEEDDQEHVMLSKINKQAERLNLTVNRIVRL